MKCYVYPKLTKSGLGNLLWIWAKSLCWAHEWNLPMLAPRWRYIDWKRYLRGDEDKRNYQGLFSTKGYVDGWRRRQIISTYKKIYPGDYSCKTRRSLILFDSLGDFSPLIGRHEFVGKYFLEMVSEEHIPDKNATPSQFIALHVRMGDFKPVDTEMLSKGGTNTRQPLEWYRDVLRACRDCIGKEMSAIVFSDGQAVDLDLLLREPNVTMAEAKSPLTDLICLSRASFLIGSRSSFSLWASYIGQMPVIYYRGARPWHEPVVCPGVSRTWEIEWMPGTVLPDHLFKNV